MKKISTFFLLFLLLGAAALHAEFDWEDLNTIAFTNTLRTEVTELFFSPADSQYWGPEILGPSRPIAPGETRSFYIHYPEQCGVFDFMAIDKNGNVYKVMEFEICDEHTAAVDLEPEQKREWIERDEFLRRMVLLEIRNRSGTDLYTVFLSPADSALFGIDYLDYNSRLAPGEVLQLRIHAEELEHRYDLLALDQEGGAFAFTLKIPARLDKQYVAVEPEDRFLLDGETP